VYDDFIVEDALSALSQNIVDLNNQFFLKFSVWFSIGRAPPGGGGWWEVGGGWGGGF